MTNPRRLVRFGLALALGAAAVSSRTPASSADLTGCASQAAASVRAARFDPAVVPAGGAGCCSVEHGAAVVGATGVRHAGWQHHGHASGCRDGLCVPACPVRPGQFGYYGTQWRRWPGQGIVQVSATEAATPVAPPKSAIPSADQESPARGGEPSGGGESSSADSEDVSPVPPDAAAPNATRPPERDAAADDRAGPWSRMVAATSLPPGYEPPSLPAEDAQ